MRRTLHMLAWRKQKGQLPGPLGLANKASKAQAQLPLFTHKVSVEAETRNGGNQIKAMQNQWISLKIVITHVKYIRLAEKEEKEEKNSRVATLVLIVSRAHAASPRPLARTTKPNPISWSSFSFNLETRRIPPHHTYPV